MQNEIDKYTEFISEVRRKSKNTVDSYRRDLKQFAAFIQKKGVNSFGDVSSKDISLYISELKGSGRAPATISRILTSVRSFYTYLIQCGRAQSDPTAETEAPHIGKRMPTVMSEAEINMLMNAPDLNDDKGLRDKAMLELLYATGIRVSELIGLNVGDVDLELKFIRCVSAKHERIIPIGSKAVSSLANYISYSRPYMVNKDGEDALFVNYNGDRLTRQGFWKIIKTYQRTAGIKTDITPHTLRHSFAAHLVENGADLHSLKEMMGYVDIASTHVYAHLIDPHIREVYAKAHPRA